LAGGAAAVTAGVADEALAGTGEACTLLLVILAAKASASAGPNQQGNSTEMIVNGHLLMWLQKQGCCPKHRVSTHSGEQCCSGNAQ
jgi:hypothetical protein